MNSICQQLHEKDIVQFGQFKLKSGKMSPIYFDLRKLGSHPKLLSQVIQEAYFDPTVDHNLHERFDLVCGVPTAGISLATAFSIHHNIPMIWARKETKEHGLKKLVEGEYKPGQRVLLLDDVITSGISLCTTIHDLENVGLEVTEVRLLIDRRPGARQTPYLVDTSNEKVTYPLRAALTMNQIIGNLSQLGVKIPPELKEEMTFAARGSQSATNPVSKYLMNIMEIKQTNLVVSADVTNSEALIDLIEAVGPYAAVIKTHIDQISDFDPSLIDRLVELKSKHNILFMEDRKFSDIGNTVKNQYLHGVYQIARWADLVTVHPLMGPGTISALYEAILEAVKQYGEKRGLILVVQASSENNLLDEKYTQKSLEMAIASYPVVSGIVSQKQLLSSTFLHMTPGVNLETNGDNHGQTYRTPTTVITQAGSDMIIVGRGIYKAKNPAEAAKEYRDQAWGAYLARVN